MRLWKKKPTGPVMAIPQQWKLGESWWHCQECAALRERYAALLAKVAEAEVKADLALAELQEWRRKAIDDDYRRRRDAGTAAPLDIGPQYDKGAS